MTTIKISIIRSNQVMNICGHDVIVENIHTKSLKFIPVGTTLKEISKELTGVDFDDEVFSNGNGIFNQDFVRICYHGYLRKMPKRIKGFVFPSLCTISTCEGIENELKDRIIWVEKMKEQIDWLRKQECFTVLGRNLKACRASVNGNPLRLVEYKDGSYYKGYFANEIKSFFEKLANEYVYDLLHGAKLSVGCDNISLSVNNWTLMKGIENINWETLEVGEFESTIINRLNLIRTEVENCFSKNDSDKLIAENEMLKKSQSGNDKKITQLQNDLKTVSKAYNELVTENERQADLCIGYRATIKNLNDKIAKISKIVC